MSEKEARIWLEQCKATFEELEQDGVWSELLRQQIDLTLSQPPDVVVLLRLLVQLRDSVEPAGHNLPFRSALDFVYGRISEEFHVHLTDDGRWEWVD